MGHLQNLNHQCPIKSHSSLRYTKRAPTRGRGHLLHNSNNSSSTLGKINTAMRMMSLITLKVRSRHASSLLARSLIARHIRYTLINIQSPYAMMKMMIQISCLAKLNQLRSFITNRAMSK